MLFTLTPALSLKGEGAVGGVLESKCNALGM